MMATRIGTHSQNENSVEISSRLDLEREAHWSHSYKAYGHDDLVGVAGRDQQEPCPGTTKAPNNSYISDYSWTLIICIGEGASYGDTWDNKPTTYWSPGRAIQVAQSVLMAGNKYTLQWPNTVY